MKGWRQAQHRADQRRLPGIREIPAPAEPRDEQRKHNAVLHEVMIEHAHPVQSLRQRGHAVAQHDDDQQRPGKLQPPRQHQQQGPVQIHPAGCDEDEHLHRIGQPAERHAQPGNAGHQQIKRPGPGDPASFRRVDIGVELHELREMRDRIQNPPRVIERVVIARHEHAAGKRGGQGVETEQEGEAPGRRPEREVSPIAHGAGVIVSCWRGQVRHQRRAFHRL